MKNLVWRLRQYPEGLPTAEHLVYGEEDIPEVKDGEIKLRTRYISMDPANRLWIRKEGSYVPPFPLGCVMPGVALGEVIESRHPRYQIGQIVQGTWGWQKYAVLDGGPLDHQLPVRDGGLLIMPDPPEGAGIIDFFGLYGVHGLTAYAGTVHVARAKEGETVLVSAAAGAIGSLVTQIARNLGCYVIGIAGGEEKCRKVVEEFRADVCIDYKRENVDERLKELAPEGVNVYFENVGGEILEAAINNMARFGRIAFCGAISQYNEATPKPPSNYMQVLYKELEIKGYLAFSYLDRLEECIQAMARWQGEGRLHINQECHEGIANALDVFNKLFSGENQGKLILKL